MRVLKGRLLPSAAVLGAVLVGLTCQQAAAVPPPDGTVQVLTAAGSDTTQDVIGALFDAYRGDGTANPDADTTVSIPSVPSAGYTVAGDDTCEERTYVPAASATPPTTYAAPSGSGAGKNALIDPANLASGCIDIARSSSGPSASDPDQLEYYAFARDAVSWAHFPGAAPNTLTLAQLRGIYDCTFTNWNEVGGGDSAIVRYVPPSSSGTRSFFVNTVLGAEPSTVCGPLKAFQENNGTSVASEDQPAAILPYSAGQWISQANGTVTDLRAGAIVGSIEGLNPVAVPDSDGRYAPDPAVINGGAFIGVRNVYNVLDTRLPTYQQSLRVVGFDDAGPGYLCAGSSEVERALNTYGFTPLPADDRAVTCTLS